MMPTIMVMRQKNDENVGEAPENNEARGEGKEVQVQYTDSDEGGEEESDDTSTE